MKNFPVDDDLVALVWQRANPRPFENLSFNEALRRVLTETQPKAEPHRKEPPRLSADELLAELEAMGDYKVTRRQRAPSPKPDNWVSSVPELRSIIHKSTSWKAICDYLKIEVAGDSARRKLGEWVKKNKPEWPTVPNT